MRGRTNVAEAFPEVARKRGEVDAAGWKRVETRLKTQDGYEAVAGFNSFAALDDESQSGSFDRAAVPQVR